MKTWNALRCAFVAVIMLISGCTSKNWYQTGQDYQRGQCIKNAQTEQALKDCQQAIDTSYEEYTQQRKSETKPR